MIKIAVCDDNEEILEEVKNKIDKVLEREHKIFTFDNGYKLQMFVKENLKGDLQILFLDIDLKDHLGIDIGKLIKKEFPHIKIIFMTGYIDYVKDIFEADPIYYLEKPIEEVRLKKALSKCILKLDEEVNDYITISSKNEIITFEYKKINYIESNLRKIIIHGNDYSKEVYMKIKDMEEKLPEKFIRCHQSFIVNLEKVMKLKDGNFVLRNGDIIPISHAKLKSSKEKFVKYLGDTI